MGGFASGFEIINGPNKGKFFEAPKPSYAETREGYRESQLWSQNRSYNNTSQTYQRETTENNITTSTTPNNIAAVTLLIVSTGINLYMNSNPVVIIYSGLMSLIAGYSIGELFQPKSPRPSR